MDNGPFGVSAETLNGPLSVVANADTFKRDDWTACCE